MREVKHGKETSEEKSRSVALSIASGGRPIVRPSRI